VLGNEWGWIALGEQGNTAAPGMSGIFFDNQNISPRTNADWNRDGSIDSVASPFGPPFDVTPKTWYRAGMAAGVAAFRAAYPGVLILGNADLMNAVGGASAVPEYNKLYDGGTLETIMGLPSSHESFIDTVALVARAQDAEDMWINPAYGIVMGVPDDGSATNYQAFRHFLTFVLTATNMCAAWSRSTGYDEWDWYDEYDFDLGPPLEARRTSAESNSIWRRDYTNGISLWCPKNVTGTISLGGTFYVLRGNAAGFLTPGAAITGVTFSSARDGLILSRTPT
jgi:hypothetical protein